MSRAPSTQRRQRHRSAGFTLIEMMIATSILAIVSAMTFASFQQTFRVKLAVESSAARYHSVRLTLERMAREITMAFLSQNEDTSMPERRTFFVAKRKIDVDELRFSMMGHQRLYADGDEADTSQVAYYGARSLDDNRKMNLMRRETRRLSNVKMEQAPGRADIVCDDVMRLQIDYWDSRDKSWRDEWSTLSADGQPGRLPSKVRVTLTVYDERGVEIPFATEVRLPMQEPLDMVPRDRIQF